MCSYFWIKFKLWFLIIQVCRNLRVVNVIKTSVHEWPNAMKANNANRNHRTQVIYSPYTYLIMLTHIDTVQEFINSTIKALGP